MTKVDFINWCEALVSEEATLKMLEGKDAAQIVLEMMRRVGEIADCAVALGSSKRSQGYKESAARDMAMQAAYVIAACQRLIDVASDFMRLEEREKV